MITLITRDLSRKKSKLILLSNFRHILLAISLTLTSPHSWKRFREVVLDVDVVQDPCCSKVEVLEDLDLGVADCHQLHL